MVALTGKSHSAALSMIHQDSRSWVKGAKTEDNNIIVYDYQPQFGRRTSHIKGPQYSSHGFPFVDSSTR